MSVFLPSSANVRGLRCRCVSCLDSRFRFILLFSLRQPVAAGAFHPRNYGFVVVTDAQGLSC